MKNKPNCPACGSGNVVYRERDKTFGCRRCGNRFKKPAK